LLDVPVTQAVGLLHCMWWWAMDFAQDGDLSKYDAGHIERGAMWDGQRGAFFDAAVAVGFIDTEPVRIHDWTDYAGRLIERRKADADRKRQGRRTESAGRPPDVLRTSDGSLTESVVTVTVPNQTITKPKKKTTAAKRAETADAGADARRPNDAYAVFRALCDETGASEDDASRSFKNQQLGIAKRLLDDGFTESDVRECVRYLKSQTWRTGIIDLRTVSAEIGRWSLAGRPAAEPIPIRPGIATGKTRDQESRDALETFLAIANGAPL